MKGKILLLTACLLSSFFAHATPPDEGMWLPMFIKRLNYEDMQKKGLQLTPEEIYSINNSSLKDAIVRLGRGFCTAEVISDKGLILTNHHCAYDVIQDNSTTENNYLRDGFWAKDLKSELPNPGLTASFLVRMEDVTEKVLANVSDEMSDADRAGAIRQAAKELEGKASEDGKYDVQVKSFFAGNEFYLFVYKTYRDVRLVGAPPEAVGKFGGDTDNWMWPRHTGDFSMLRIYAGPDNEPADYSENNVPLKPKHHLPISLKGVKEGDYAMVMGYPGSTDRYLSSYGVKMALEKSQPTTVKIRGERLDLLKEDMDESEEIRLKYASKYASVSNYWKYFIGQQAGLKRLKVYDKKKALEDQFNKWVTADQSRKEKYGEATKLLEEGYAEMQELALSRVYLNEAALGSEILRFAFRFLSLDEALNASDPDQGKIKKMAESLKKRAEGFYKEYNAPTDQKVTAALLELYYKGVPKNQHPDLFTTINSKYKGNFEKYAAVLFKKSIFADQSELNAFLADPSAKVLSKDPAMAAINSIFTNFRTNIAPKMGPATQKIAKGNRLFIDGIRKMNANKKYYPNANSTMRLTYGTVLPYQAKDAVNYDYVTTSKGILEKEIPNDQEFHVPPKLHDLLVKKDFGQYAENGELITCFLTNNDITGGNSGSPVINAKGELIGVAFDGNWEAMSGDIAFEPELQRCINVDIRYVLFIIDKYANAKHLVDEMTLRK
ncbi:MAG: S46 family peptidase [Flammeovirgaceae bacterium]